MGTIDDIENNTYQIKNLLERTLESDVRPRVWHGSNRIPPITEKRYNVFKNLGNQGGRYLRIKVSRNCTIKLTLGGVGQQEKFEEGLKPNKVGKFKFKPPMLLMDFYILPSATGMTTKWWISTTEMSIDIEDDITHLDGDTFEPTSDRCILIAGQDGSRIRTIRVDRSGNLVPP